MADYMKVPCVIMRGGTSKAVFLEESVLPADPAARERFILAIFGSPDKRQIDGLGGADLLTSKCAIVAPGDKPGVDINYTFAQVGVAEATISYDINCGNIISAVGVYAIEEGLVPATEPITDVRVYNTNVDSVVTITVPVADGEPAIEGTCAISGVPGTGAEISLDYSNTAGASTDGLLPTGNVVDTLRVPTLSKDIPATIIDIGNLSVLFFAEDVGIPGTQAPEDFTEAHLDIFDEIREAAAAPLKLPAQATMIPYQIMIAPPADEDTDLDARMGTLRGIHKALPVGGATCVAAAALIEGTIACAAARLPGREGRVRIGHPSGVMEVYANMRRAGEDWEPEAVRFERTARRLMDGTAYVRRSALAEPV